MKSDRAWAVALLLLAVGIVPARANLITNGSFESESTTVPTGNFLAVAPGDTTITGWTVFGGVVSPVSTALIGGSFSSVTDGNVNFTFTAEDGVVWMDLTGVTSNSTEGVEQTVSTNSGDQYSLTFYVGNVYDPGGIYGTTSTVGVLINGTQVTACENSDDDATAQATAEWNWVFAANFIGDGHHDHRLRGLDPLGPTTTMASTTSI